MIFNKWTEAERKYCLIKNVKDDYPSIEVTKSEDSRYLPTDVGMNQWRTQAELVKWAEYLVLKFKELP